MTREMVTAPVEGEVMDSSAFVNLESGRVLRNYASGDEVAARLERVKAKPGGHLLASASRLARLRREAQR